MRKKVKGVVVAAAIPLASNAAAHSCDYQSSVEALALNIYHEARGESEQGKQMVGEVTLNRVESPRYPDTVCDVVYQKMQFSWTHSLPDTTPRETGKWEEAVELAEDLIADEIDVYGNGATHFLNPNTVGTMPRWAREFEVVTRIGNHVFYRKRT